MTALQVRAQQQTAGTDLTAPDQAQARFDFLVVIIEAACTDITAIQFIAVTQIDVERARNRITRATRGGRADDLDAGDQFGGDTVEEEAPVGAAAGDALTIDQDLGIAGRQAAQTRRVAFDDVRQKGDGGHALERIASGQRLETLKIVGAIFQHGFGGVGAIAIADPGDDDDVGRLGNRPVRLGDLVGGSRCLRLRGNGKQRNRCATKQQPLTRDHICPLLRIV